MRAILSATAMAAAAFGLWAACGDDDNGTDVPDVPRDDGGGTEAGDDGGDEGGALTCTRSDECPQGFVCESGVCDMVLPPLTETGADMSCVGNNPPPTPGTGVVTANLYVEDFEDEYRVEGAVLDLFFDNVIDDTPDATVGPTDENGQVTGIANVPQDNLIAYRLHGDELPGGEVKTTVEYDVETPEADGGDIRCISVSDTTYRLIPTILGIAPDPAHAILAGEFDDCAEPPAEPEPTEGVVVRLVNAAGEDCHVLDEHECYARYFQEEYPARLDNQPYSSADGLYAFAQVPPGVWTLEVRGRLTEASATFPFDLLGKKDVNAIADAIVIVDVNPLAEPED